MIKRLNAIRHGETEGNVGGIAQGWNDSPLTEKGLAQVRAVARRAPSLEPTSIWASPLGRCGETARIIGEAVGIEPKHLDDLREVHCGRWEGQNFMEVREREADYFEKWVVDPTIPCPDGESLDDVRKRLATAMKTITEGDPGERPMIVSHATSIKVLASVLLGWPLTSIRQLVKSNTAVSTFHQHDGEFYLLRWNDQSHWQPQEESNRSE